MSYWAVVLIVLLAFLSGYAFAIYTLSKRISFDRYIILERLYLATLEFYRAEDYDTLDDHGERIRKLVRVLGGRF